MPDETPSTFEEIKPFLRMLEGSIDEARARRLATEGGSEPNNSAGRPGEHSAAHSTPNGSTSPSSADDSEDTAIGRYRPGPGQAQAKQATPKHANSNDRPSSLATPNYRM